MLELVTMWYNVVYYDVVWYNRVWYNVVWYCMAIWYIRAMEGTGGGLVSGTHAYLVHP